MVMVHVVKVTGRVTRERDRLELLNHAGSDISDYVRMQIQRDLIRDEFGGKFLNVILFS